VIGERPQYRQVVTIPPILSNIFGAHSLAAGGPGYLLSGQKYVACTGIPFTVTSSPAACQWDIVALRFGPNGELLDSNPIILNRGEPEFSEFDPFTNSTFDGTNWLVAVMQPRPLDAGRPFGGPVFLARLAPDGTVLDAEEEALLVAPIETAFGVTVTRTSASPLVAWRDGRDSGVTFHSVYAQRVLP